MKCYRIDAVIMLLFVFLIVSCSKETDIKQQVEFSEPTTKKTFVYDGKEYTLVFNEKGGLVPTKDSELLENLVANEKDATTFTFGQGNYDKLFLFNSEMEGYKYFEEHIDQKIGRKLQLGCAISLLRDQLIAEYGTDLDYTNSALYNKAKQGVEAIYRDLKVANDFPKDIEAFIGKAHDNNAAARSNGSFRLWEHPNSLGDMFDLEAEPNVSSWTHGNWNCYLEHYAPDLNLNFRSNNQTWDDCMSSLCMSYQPGSDAMACAVNRHPNYYNDGCDRHIFVHYGGNPGDFTCISNLVNSVYVNFFCGNMENNISCLRMRYVWSTCPIAFSDMQ